MRRVLLTGDTAGGVWTFTVELAKGLIGQGLEICLATFGPSVSDNQRKSAAEMSGLEWLHCDSKLEWMEDPWADIDAGGSWLRAVLYGYQPDVVHLNTLSYGAIQSQIPSVMTIHSCVPSWWAAVKASPLPDHWSRYCAEVERSLGAVNLVTAPSHAALEAARPHFEVDLSGAFSVYNGRSSEHLKRGKKEPFILSAGRLWDEGKNVRLLASLESCLPWRIYLAGEHRSPSGAGAAPQGCRLLGHLHNSDLAVLYSRASIYAAPARYEPFGLSILEAALSGCALVLGDIPSLREIWQNAARFVDPGDVNGWETALHQLIDEPGYLREMGDRAYVRAQEFPVSRMVRSYLAAYETAIDRHQQEHWRRACAS